MSVLVLFSPYVRADSFISKFVPSDFLHVICLLVILVSSHFVFEGKILIMIVPDLGYCLSFYSSRYSSVRTSSNEY